MVIKFVYIYIIYIIIYIYIFFFFQLRGFKEVCQVLVENGADFDLKDSDNDTPLSLTDDEDLKSIMMSKLHPLWIS